MLSSLTDSFGQGVSPGREKKVYSVKKIRGLKINGRKKSSKRDNLFLSMTPLLFNENKYNLLLLLVHPIYDMKFKQPNKLNAV